MSGAVGEASVEAERVVMKSYRVSREMVLNMHARTEDLATTLQGVVEAYLRANGINLSEGEERKVFYNDRTGILLVRASEGEIERIDQLLKQTNSPEQVKVEMRIAEFHGEVMEEELKEPLQMTRIPGNLETDPKSDEAEVEALRPRVWTKVLTEAQMKVVMQAMEQREGADIASAPAVTTLSGRMARLAIEQTPVITDPPFTAPGKGMKARWSK